MLLELLNAEIELLFSQVTQVKNNIREIAFVKNSINTGLEFFIYVPSNHLHRREFIKSWD